MRREQLLLTTEQRKKAWYLRPARHNPIAIKEFDNVFLEETDSPGEFYVSQPTHLHVTVKSRARNLEIFASVFDRQNS